MGAAATPAPRGRYPPSLPELPEPPTLPESLSEILDFYPPVAPTAAAAGAGPSAAPSEAGPSSTDAAATATIVRIIEAEVDRLTAGVPGAFEEYGEIVGRQQKVTPEAYTYLQYYNRVHPQDQITYAMIRSDLGLEADHFLQSWHIAQYIYTHSLLAIFPHLH
eukprot:3581835-Pleurochrysis_carterae.AAC.1